MSQHLFAVRLSKSAKPVKVEARDWKHATEIVLHKAGFRRRCVHDGKAPVRLFSSHTFTFNGELPNKAWKRGTASVKLVEVTKPTGKSIAVEGTGSCYHQSAYGTVLHCRLSRSTAWLSNAAAKTVVDKLGKCKTQAEIDTVIRGVV